MIQVVVHHLLKLLSEIHIDSDKIMNTLLLLKECIVDNSFIVVLKQHWLLEMFYQLIKFQKVQLFAMLKEELVIKGNSQEQVEQVLLLLDILKI